MQNLMLVCLCGLFLALSLSIITSNTDKKVWLSFSSNDELNRLPVGACPADVLVG